MLSRPSQMRTEPSMLIQPVGLYLLLTRYSCVWRGLIRVKLLSAFINSASKLIRHLVIGRAAQIPNTPAYSLISVSPGPSAGSGVTNVNDPSPLALHPSG